ncbi:MAG: hypothetical protein ACRDQ0_03405 [Pseudonocardia sp.]
MTSALAPSFLGAILFTPFGVPFDTAVIAGAVLTGIAVVLAGRRGRDEEDA